MFFFVMNTIVMQYLMYVASKQRNWQSVESAAEIKLKI